MHRKQFLIIYVQLIFKLLRSTTSLYRNFHLLEVFQLSQLQLLYIFKLSVYHPRVFTKCNKMVFTSQTHLLFLYLMYYYITLSTKIKGVLVM